MSYEYVGGAKMYEVGLGEVWTICGTMVSANQLFKLEYIVDFI